MLQIQSTDRSTGKQCKHCVSNEGIGIAINTNDVVLFLLDQEKNQKKSRFLQGNSFGPVFFRFGVTSA